MPEQYVVPQFIDAEDKIFGPITARQFIILMITGMLIFLFFKLLPFVPFLIVGVPLLMLGGTIAFVRINGQAFHYFLLNLIQTFKKPHIRVWDKTISDAQVREYMREVAPVVPASFQHKASIGSSRLQELSLVVNTGGVYRPEEE